MPDYEVERTIQIGQEAGYKLIEIGQVEEGKGQVIFEPENIILSPPGE